MGPRGFADWLRATITGRESGDTDLKPSPDADGSRRFGRSGRGQSEVLGTVLILGLSMAVIGTSLTLGGVAVGDLITDAESTNVETGMAHLSSKISLVALGDSDSQRFSLGAMRAGTLSVQPEAGSIRVYNATGGSRELLNDNRTTMGALVYAGEDREIAYQGGGIWTKQGNTSRMTSPPEYHYRGTTLTLPIINVTGEGAIGGRPSGQITPVTVAEDAVPGVSTPLESGTIEIEIQSDYYQGWYAFLNDRTEGETEIYHSNQTVVSTLTVPDTVTFDTALSVGSIYDGSGNGNVNNGNGNNGNNGGGNNPLGSTDYEDNVQHRSAQPLIASKIAEANESNADEGCLPTCDNPLTAGTYYVDEDLTLSQDIEIDTSSGNVTLIVDGTFDVSEYSITVTGDATPETGVKYYVNNSLHATGNSAVGTDQDAPQADRNVFYIGDGLFDSSTGTGTIDFDAVLYAPDSTLDIAGNGHFNGSIAVNDVEKIKGSISINYDPDLADTTIDLTGAADLLKYLHVSHNEIRIDVN